MHGHLLTTTESLRTSTANVVEREWTGTERSSPKKDGAMERWWRVSWTRTSDSIKSTILQEAVHVRACMCVCVCVSVCVCEVMMQAAMYIHVHACNVYHVHCTMYMYMYAWITWVCSKEIATTFTYWYMSTCSSARMMSLSSSMLSPGETPIVWST